MRSLNSKALAIIIVVIGTWFTVLSAHYDRFEEYIVTIDAVPDEADTAVIFGTVIEGGLPDLQRERLEMGRMLYERGVVDQIVLSNTEEAVGDMREYLVSGGVPESVLVIDGDAVMTSDTCPWLQEREKEDAVVLVTQAFHMKRALYLCHGLGVEAYGIEAEGAGVIERDNSLSALAIRGYRWGRERVLMSLHLLGLYK